jgi:hypothetical protein
MAEMGLLDERSEDQVGVTAAAQGNPPAWPGRRTEVGFADLPD